MVSSSSSLAFLAFFVAPDPLASARRFPAAPAWSTRLISSPTCRTNVWSGSVVSVSPVSKRLIAVVGAPSLLHPSTRRLRFLV